MGNIFFLGIFILKRPDNLHEKHAWKMLKYFLSPLFFMTKFPHFNCPRSTEALAISGWVMVAVEDSRCHFTF